MESELALALALAWSSPFPSSPPEGLVAIVEKAAARHPRLPRQRLLLLSRRAADGSVTPIPRVTAGNAAGVAPRGVQPRETRGGWEEKGAGRAE